MSRRLLIVNADDFGRSPGVNRGIAYAHEHGIVTSASLMVRYPAAAEAAAYAAEHDDLSVGLHVDLGEWVFREGEWASVYELEPAADEVERQLEEFRRLTGSDPTHLDSHQHVHREEPSRSILLGLADELGIPLRHYSAVRHVGFFYGQDRDGSPLPDGITAAALVEIVTALDAGVSELGCHPGEADAELDSVYRSERAREVKALCDPIVRAALEREGIELCSFGDFAGRV